MCSGSAESPRATLLLLDWGDDIEESEIVMLRHQEDGALITCSTGCGVKPMQHFNMNTHVKSSGHIRALVDACVAHFQPEIDRRAAAETRRRAAAAAAAAAVAAAAAEAAAQAAVADPEAAEVSIDGDVPPNAFVIYPISSPRPLSPDPPFSEHDWPSSWNAPNDDDDE